MPAQRNTPKIPPVEPVVVIPQPPPPPVQTDCHICDCHPQSTKDISQHWWDLRDFFHAFPGRELHRCLWVITLFSGSGLLLWLFVSFPIPAITSIGLKVFAGIPLFFGAVLATLTWNYIQPPGHSPGDDIRSTSEIDNSHLGPHPWYRNLQRPPRDLWRDSAFRIGLAELLFFWF